MERTCAFGELTVRFDGRVLEPRPWTAAQSKWAAELLAELPDGPLLEMCTGAGQIGLLAAHLSGRAAVLVDRDPVACDFARANAEAAGIADRVEVRQADLAEALRAGETFVLAAIDPPWVPSAHTTDFPEDPLGAIDGGPDGLSLARAALRAVEPALADAGVVVLQIGNAEQAEVLESWLELPSTPHLTVTEVRTHPRGVLALLQRKAPLR